MGYLYISSSGNPQRKHSYSSGNLWDRNPFCYKLQKIDGWKEKQTRARFLFGIALETAIQHHHEHDGKGAVDCFVKLWQEHADKKDLQYTRVEKDWANLLKTGTEMVRLYQIRQPELPIPLGGQTLFQKTFEKEVFPNDPIYGEILDVGKLDIVAYVDPNHPMLPRLNWKPEYGPLRPVIIDIKTAGADFSEQYGMAAYDVQLRRYSWHTGIRDVAFLTFVKKGHSLQKGYSVTLLEDAGAFKAGQEAVIAQMDEDHAILVANDSLIEEMERVQGKKADGKTEQTKVAKERRDEWLSKFGARVHVSSLTKQRLQFNAGFVSIESANDAGEIAGQQIIEIVNAWHRKSYPNKFSVRYPHDDTSDPYFRAFVLKDEMFKSQNFTKTDSTNLDDLFKEDEAETND